MLAGLFRAMLPSLGLAGLLLVGALYVQTQRLDAAERHLVEVRAELEISKRVIVQLERDAAEQERRTQIETEAREDIIRMPEDVRKAPLPDIWRRSFRAADEIGGAQ